MRRAVSSAPIVRRSTVLPTSQATARLHIADFLLIGGLALWGFGVSRAKVTTLGPFGLIGALPIVYYAGLAVLVISAGAELARRSPSGWRLSLHAAALVVMLYGTAPLVYSQGRYSWLYKTIGVVQYVNEHGQLNRHIDIYQNWPGFFAFAAWFGKAAGVASPLSYAKWAQLAFELAALPLLYLIYDALSLSLRQRWLALLLFSAGNWIGQDYFSPQALGTIMSLGIMALAMRWLYLADSRNDRRSSAPASARVSNPWLICATIVGLYFVLTFTHELSPYILVVQLGALAIARLLQPRWLPIVLAAIAIGYLVPRFTFVSTHYGVLKSIGNFFTNAEPPAFVAGNVTGSQQIIERCAEVLSAGMWALAVLAVWLHRRSWRRVLGLALLAFTPIMVLAIQAYGQEGILRVYLFSLPWTVALVASVLAPGAEPAAEPALTSAAGPPAEAAAEPSDGPPAGSTTRPATEPAARPVEDRGSPSGRSGLLHRRPSWDLVRGPLVLAVAIALFFPAFFGDDSFNRMTQAEVSSVASFLDKASAGPVFAAIDNAPLAFTARYNVFPLTRIFGSYSLMKKSPVTPAIADRIANDALSQTHGREPAYVLITPSMIAYNQAYRVTGTDSFAILVSALAHSSRWKLILDRGGTVIYEMPAQAAS